MKAVGVVLSILLTILIAVVVVLAIVLIIYAAAPNQFATAFNEKMHDGMKIPNYNTNAQEMFPCREIENQYDLWKSMADSAKPMAEQPEINLKPIEKLQKMVGGKKKINAFQPPTYLQTLWKNYGTVKIQGKLEENASADWMYLPDILGISFIFVEAKAEFSAPNIPGTVSYLLPFTDANIFVKSDGENKSNQMIEKSEKKGFVVRPDTTLTLDDPCYFLVVSFIPKKMKGIVSNFNASFSKLLNKVHRWKQVSHINKRFWKQ